MTEIIQQWIQDRLGIIHSISPYEFADDVKDGRLIAEILRSYEIITDEQLKLIETSDSQEVCLSNFKDHIRIWLKIIGIYIDDEELMAIVEGTGTVALNLFYQLYLELHANSNLTFITRQRLKEKLRQKGKFPVKRVRETSAPVQGDFKKEDKYDEPLKTALDIVHWQKDRMQMLQAKCKEAREEYLQYIRMYQEPKPRLLSANNATSNGVDQDVIINDRPGSVHVTYEDLIQQQKRARLVPKFVPDIEKAKQILKALRTKRKIRSENLIFRSELQRDIYTTFWSRVNKEEEDRLNKNVTDAILKQSLFEKQLHAKVLEVKQQRDNMLFNKQQEVYAISKQVESDYIHKLLLKDKEADEKEIAYYIEKERIKELHEKLYEKKLQLKREIGQKICAETAKDLVELAFNEAEYKRKIGEDAPRRLKDSWRKMFVNEIPFDDFVTPTEVILMKPEERPEEIEEIVHLEIDKQDMLDQKDFESYLENEWPWLLDLIDIDSRNLNDWVCAMNVLGNVVHTLLAAKYPFPPLPPKPDFPDITICACINGIDVQCLPLLQKILDTRQVLVVQMQDCINYCLHAYIEEATEEILDDGVNSDEKAKEEKKKKEKKKEEVKPEKKKGAKAKSSLKAAEEPVAVKIEFVEKMVQTPKIYPGEEVPLSTKAELGKVAQEVLLAGEPLTNHILAAMFVEYIKSKPNIKGWALLNYPKTYEEAAVLEERLTGLPVPRLDDHNSEDSESIIELAELEEKKSAKEVDEFALARVSKILPQPVPPSKTEFYDTALTAYIKVIKRVGGDKTDKRDKRENSIPLTTLESLESSGDPLEKFYADLGCNYQFYYNKLDFNAIKYLAKLVVGDYSIPMKSSVELFGDVIKSIALENDNFTADEPPSSAKKGEKKQKPKERKPRQVSEEDVPNEKRVMKNKVDLKGGKKNKGQVDETVVIEHVDKSTQAPEEEEEEEEQEIETVDFSRPGEKGWTYVSIPVPESLQVPLATLWENAEEVYINDMEQVLFMKRILLNAVIPFINSVKEHMAEYMNKPDEKQKYLRAFQKAYNDFDDDFRADDDFKAEMHCRINDMKEKLTEICDWKMIAADHERVFIIEKNWAARQLIQLTNNYINAMQLELDRYADSMLLISDYYYSMVKKMPSEATIVKELITKIEAEHPETIKAVNSLLQNVDDAPEVALHQFVENVCKKSMQFVEATQVSVKSSWKKIKDLFDAEITAKDKIKSALKEKKNTKGGRASVNYEFQLEDEILQVHSQITNEWNYAIKGEVVRVKARLQLLKLDLFRNLDEVLDTIRRTFYSIHQKIRILHEKELNSIDAVCRMLSLAVERERKVQEELILYKEDFYVDPEVILFPDPLPTVKPISEFTPADVFSINQLDRIVDILMDLAPNGYMPERSFTYLLQDLIVNHDDPVLVPETWKKLQPRHVNQISKLLFDDLEYVQWRDFIVYNLLIPFPSLDEILDLRKNFRSLDTDLTELITDYQYLEIKFWFEEKMHHFRLKLLRQLLFKLYRVKGDRMNYTALLMDFSKDSNPVMGLTKALTVSLGKAVCWNTEAGQLYIEMSKKHKLREELKQERKEQLKGGKDIVEQIYTDLIDTVTDVDNVKKEDTSSDVESIIVISSESDIKGDVQGTDSKTDIKVEPVPDLAYFLPLDVIITVITTCLSWHARVQNIEDKSFREVIEEIYKDCQNSEFDNKVFAHVFLSHPILIDQLNKTGKFSAKDPVKIIQDILSGSFEEKIEEKVEEKVPMKPKK